MLCGDDIELKFKEAFMHDIESVENKLRINVWRTFTEEEELGEICKQAHSHPGDLRIRVVL